MPLLLFNGWLPESIILHHGGSGTAMLSPLGSYSSAIIITPSALSKPFQNGIILRRRRRRLSNQPKRNDEYFFF